jgi:hypothetical protein
LAFVSLFPTRPFADFKNLVRFAEAYAADGFARGFSGWEFWSLGLPLALSLLLRVVPGQPAEIARHATVAITGLTAVVPFIVWRGVFGFSARMLAGLLLALWPGHIIVAGVVSQDNWLLLAAFHDRRRAVRQERRCCGWRPAPFGRRCFSSCSRSRSRQPAC